MYYQIQGGRYYMQIKYNVAGTEERRWSRSCGILCRMRRDTSVAPSFAFQVGAYTVDKNGTVTCPDETDEAQITMLIRELAHDGFIGERIGEQMKPFEQKAETALNEIVTPTHKQP